MKSKTKERKKSFSELMEDTKLRLTLLRIWFVKNFTLWLQIFIIVCVVLMLTGNITADTPVLGWIIYPIFKPLIDDITEIVSSHQLDRLMDVFAIIITILTSTGLVLARVRSITQKDIKNDKLKRALISANLYFNSNGKLVQKIEKATNTDLNGDNKVDDQDTTVTTVSLFRGFFTAIHEFFIIISADISSKDDSYNKTLEESGLKESADAQEEAIDLVKESVRIEIEPETEAEDTVINKSGLKGLLSKIFGKKKKSTEKETNKKKSNKLDVLYTKDAEEFENDKNSKIEEISSKPDNNISTAKKITMKEVKPQPAKIVVKADPDKNKKADPISSYLSQFKK